MRYGAGVVGRVAGAFFLGLGLMVFVAAGGWAGSGQGKREKKGAATTSLTIRVVSEEKGEPVVNASVYLRFQEKEALLFLLHKNHKVELDLKTDDRGYASFDELPKGKVLIQVVAPEWQTFGEYYQLNQAKQTVQIKLHKPKTRWY